MVQPIIECVPNISEGRNTGLINKIIDSITQSENCSVLGVEPDVDYNRTVVTIAGNPEQVYNAAFELIKASIELIDMSKHQGEHPRLGVVDVCPFIPLSGYTMEECVRLAEKLAKEVSEQFNVSTFLYGYAAKSPERKLLSTLRKGEYEGLEARLSNTDQIHSDATRLPDFGPRTWTDECKKSGGITIGARDILIAYNVNVEETDAVVAKKIGSIIRGSGRLIKQANGKKMRIRGMIPEIQGIGVTLESHSISQVSMNILDVSNCPIHKAFEICKSIANDHATKLKGSELVGLVPLKSMLEAGKWYSNQDNPSEDELVTAAIDGLGLSELDEFNPRKRIIEWALRGD
jgi:glutamate formiminotransferase/formiminotetrahydrofolate cyclodeaminase